MRPMRSAPRRSHSGVDCQRTRPSASVTRAMRSPVVAIWSSWPARPGTARRITESVPPAPRHGRLLDRARCRCRSRRPVAQRRHDAATTGSTGLLTSPAFVERACSIAFRRSRRSFSIATLASTPRPEASRGVYARSTQRACLPIVPATNLCPTPVGRCCRLAAGPGRRPPPGAHGTAGSGAGPPARLPLPALQTDPQAAPAEGPDAGGADISPSGLTGAGSRLRSARHPRTGLTPGSSSPVAWSDDRYGARHGEPRHPSLRVRPGRARVARQGRLPRRRGHRRHRLPRRPAPEARPGRGPGRHRQDAAGQVGGRDDRRPAHPPPVLRGPRRVQGALRVELQEAAPAHPGRAERRRHVGRRRGRHLLRRLPPHPPAARGDPAPRTRSSC